jgi:hypothetical protein
MHSKSKNCDINVTQQNFAAVFKAQNKLEVQYINRNYKICSKTAKEENSAECYNNDKKV